VTSLARPGGNITGVSLMAAEMHGKCVELFRDIFPSMRRIAVLLNAADPFSKQDREQVQLAGRTIGIEIAPSVMVRGPDEIDAAFAAMKNEGAGAVVVQGSLTTKDVADLGGSNAVVCRSRRADLLRSRWSPSLSAEYTLRDQNLAGWQPQKYAD
jgi:putative ABC transport system substrate-binding protein